MNAQAISTNAALPRLVRQLEGSEWRTPEAIATSQRRHLVRLAEHGLRSSPAFAARLARAGLTPRDFGHPDGLAALPTITRREVQRAGAKFFCRNVPAGHGAVEETTTSGSTGEPVVIRGTAVTRLFWYAMAMRQMRWHRRNLNGRLCTINPRYTSHERRNDWGRPVTDFTTTGPAVRLPLAADTAQLASWVADFDPTFLVLYPSVLAALTRHAVYHGTRLPALEHVLTIGEALSPQIRADARAALGATVTDLYSAEEFGHIALECPVSGLYHVMGESVVVEVLDANDAPVAEGDIGRVVVTDLHNYATPLIRYAIGDYAQLGPPCPCGRGLPTLTRVVGRARNLLRMPDGSRRWPLTGFLYCREVAPVVQYQLVQQDETTIEVRLVVERALSREEEDALRDLVHRWSGFPFTLRFTYFEGRLPVGQSSKHEDVICNIPELPVCAASV
jgi:phenylacetate-CoA ligase